MTERFPDLEIYLMKASAAEVQQWLEQALGEPVLEVSAQHWRCGHNGETLDVFFNPQAEKNFASLWFKQNHTPWATDLDCGRAAHAALGVEVRCSDSGWQETEGEESSSGWIKLIRGEEKPFEWR